LDVEPEFFAQFPAQRVGGSPIVFQGERAWLRVSTFLEHEMNPNAWRSG
jgi:hypothetical protein